MKEDIENLEIAIDNSRYSFEEFEYYQSLDEITMTAIENLIKSYRELEEENTDLKELYVRVTKNIKEKGNLELAEYMLAQIEATPTFTTWEDYKTWVSKDKIRAKIEELKDKEEELTDDQGYWGYTELITQIEVLEDLLEED